MGLQIDQHRLSSDSRACAVLDEKASDPDRAAHLFDCIRVDETPASSDVGFPNFVTRVAAARVRSIRRGSSAVTGSACMIVSGVEATELSALTSENKSGTAKQSSIFKQVEVAWNYRVDLQ